MAPASAGQFYPRTCILCHWDGAVPHGSSWICELKASPVTYAQCISSRGIASGLSSQMAMAANGAYILGMGQQVELA
ncbi:hypothetical protein PGTUg99_002705 [Puccinia graminis f. sp. tritici]|uniref:Uncharacterized protein n=1 Tax=Puccinia graminis f. sp. tritici TaxID=56615 RepID=A0A5B0RNP6_PUCGR|nr:hypothetical protein PGTUg99_019795 [Puccinia graminis f. sp. tritici]KAA1127581.1 hypothetical protein PGTUg99_002705 [Puccinia graminis f. sp. tritici]